MMRVEVNINSANVGLMASNATEYAVAALSEQALQDCNYYCKQDMGALIQSSLIHSDTRHGVLKWTMPYAEHQYFNPGTRTDKNPNAGPEWCQRAYEAHHDEWDRVFQNALSRGGL